MGFIDLLKRGFLYNSKKVTTDKDYLVRTDKNYVESLKKASEELEAIANEVDDNLDEIAIEYDLDKVIYMTKSYDNSTFVIKYDKECDYVGSISKEKLLKSDYYIHNFKTYGIINVDRDTEKVDDCSVYCNKNYIKSVENFTLDKLIEHFKYMSFLNIDKNTCLLEFRKDFVITKSTMDLWTVITFTTEEPLVVEQKEKSNG